MSGRVLDPGALPKDQRRGRIDRHLLALTGGGYRGLFTATTIRQLEKSAAAGLASHFDMIAGTSIGGIIAIGLGCGTSGEDLAELIREHGPAIFRPRPMSVGGYIGSHYSDDGLKTAVVAAIGKANAKRSFAEIPVPLVVCAVDETTSRPKLFRTNAAAGGKGDDLPTMNVALATSAAPTYFPPHRIGDRTYVDGGIVANAPDVLLLMEAMREFGCSLEDCHLLSLGTAGSPREGKVSGRPGKLGWVTRHALVDLIVTSSEQLALQQAASLAPGTFMRVDAHPTHAIELDDVGEQTTTRLIALAEDAISAEWQSRQTMLRRFLTHRPQARTPLDARDGGPR